MTSNLSVLPQLSTLVSQTTQNRKFLLVGVNHITVTGRASPSSRRSRLRSQRRRFCP